MNGDGPKRLYRDPDQRMLGGVSAGLASYFGIDPTLVRLGFVLLSLGPGWGLILYLVLWVVMPLPPGQRDAATEIGAKAQSAIEDARHWAEGRHARTDEAVVGERRE